MMIDLRIVSNFGKMYNQIVKYGKTFGDLAIEYNLEEEELIEHLRKRMEKDVFKKMMKANEEHLKARKKCADKKSSGEESVGIVSIEETEEESMSRNEEKREQQYRLRQSERDKTLSRKQFFSPFNFVGNGENEEPESAEAETVDTVEVLEEKRANQLAEINQLEKDVDETLETLQMRQKAVSETHSAFEKAKKEWENAVKQRNEVDNLLEEQQSTLAELKKVFSDLENKIEELKKEKLYLVAPEYSGEMPEYGTLVSTEKVEGMDVAIIEPERDYTIEPELKDMVYCGYDSYKEYMQGLRFVMLCNQYTLEEKEYTVLTSDERIKKLIDVHSI